MRLWIIPVSFGTEMVWRVIRSCTKLLKFQIRPLESPEKFDYFFTQFSSKLLLSEFFREEKIFFLLVRIENPGASRNGIILLLKKGQNSIIRQYLHMASKAIL